MGAGEVFDGFADEGRAGDDATDARWITETELVRLKVNPATRRLLTEKFDFGK